MSEIIIESNNSEKAIERKIEINQITCAPVWGGIAGDIGAQSDLMTLFNTKENKNRTILESDNFDEVTANGKYSANYGTIMLDVANAYGQVFQRAVYQSTNEEKFRWQIGGEWNDWITLANSDDLAKKQDIEPVVLPSGTNPDNVVTNGKYSFDNTVLIVTVSGDFVYQTHILDEVTIMYRGSNSGTWDIWFQLANNSDLTYKVDKVDGKGLSTNDYTNTEKTKLNSAVTSSTIATIVTLTQAAYDALNPKVATTLYIITGA